jgi:hypothetical protein
MTRQRFTSVWLMATLASGPLVASEVLAQDTLNVGAADDEQGTDVLDVVVDSLKLLLLEHGARVVFQEKTRNELPGNFFADHRRSLRWPAQWGDTDSGLVNYVGHPIHGAAAGYIWLDHEPGAPSELVFASRYWASRTAFAWSASYSLQFEIGPFSEASIGNVGLRPETVGWVDHVVTPVGAFALIVAEDALDRYVVKWAERRVKNQILRIAIRFAANPGRTLANTASGRVPWHRDGRPVNWRRSSCRVLHPGSMQSDTR